MKTYSPKSHQITRTWHLIDADNAVLGRLATQIAVILMGKNKAMYAPHVDSADHIVVINAAKVHLTGNKETQKVYRHHSGYPGGMKVTSLALMRENHPDRIIRAAVAGMLPKNRLQDRRLKHLHIYAEATHPYEKQFKKAN